MTNINRTGRTQDLPDAAACGQQSVVHVPNLQQLYFKNRQLHRMAAKCTVLKTSAIINILKCENFML